MVSKDTQVVVPLSGVLSSIGKCMFVNLSGSEIITSGKMLHMGYHIATGSSLGLWLAVTDTSRGLGRWEDDCHQQV